jgi:hypothetical protein
MAGKLGRNLLMEQAVLDARKSRIELLQRIKDMDDESLLLHHRLVISKRIL